MSLLYSNFHDLLKLPAVFVIETLGILQSCLNRFHSKVNQNLVRISNKREVKEIILVFSLPGPKIFHFDMVQQVAC